MGLKELSSYKSLWRGYQYYLQDKVLNIKLINSYEYETQVTNDDNLIYEIHLDLKHPRKSTCNCPHAEGRRIICKHMVASYFAVFPEEAQAYLREIEQYEKEQEERYQKSLEFQEQRINQIKKYVNKLNKAELKEKLIEYMIDSEFFDDDLY